MPDQVKEKISEEISQSKEKIAQNLKLHELSQDLNDLMKTVSETSKEIATGISSITAKARWLENGNHYYFLQKIKNVCSVQCLLFSELGVVKSAIDDSQITSKISKVFNRLDSSIEKTEKKISSFEENLSKKLMRGVVIKNYQKLKFYIDYEQQKNGPSVYCEYVKLSKKWLKLEEK